jgi:hypothetical protein
VIGAALAVAACARSDLPIPAIPGLGLGASEEAEITGRVWLDATPGAAQGAFLVFLPDGTLVQDSCGETWRLSPWRRVDPTTLVWEEDGATIRAEIAIAGAEDLALLIAPENNPAAAMSRQYRAARAPMLCPGGG